MVFRQLVDRDLGCASYLVGSGGRGVVVDPGLDVAPLLAAADEEGLRVELVVETHVHADHVSGRALVAERTGAAVRLPAGGGYEAGAGDELRDGDTIALGDVRITALATPGHRPEHIALLVADRARSPDPWLLLSGDSLLIGDLARPDLAIDAHDGARILHATLARLGALPAHLELWPGHVGASLCGGPGLSRKTSSTLGYEREANPLLRLDADALAERLLASLPPRPPTVAHVVARNRTLVPAAAGAVDRLAPAALAAALVDGVTLIDARSSAAFDAGHVRGSLSLALQGNALATRAAWVLGPADKIAVLADDEPAALELARRLAAVGLSALRGVVAGDLPALAQAAGLSLEAVPAIPVAALPQLVGEVMVVDVRERLEWSGAHLPDAIHLPLSRLRAEEAQLPDGPLAIVCGRGPRAAFAASWLRGRGHDARRVADGGIVDLPQLGLELVAA